MRGVFVLLILVAALLTACAPTGGTTAVKSIAPPAHGTGPWNMTIFHLNDQHAAFEAEPASWRDDHALVGGIVAVKSHLDEQRALSTASITLDAGDFMTGHPICDIEVGGVLGGGLMDMFNQLGLDAGVIGNHEFDLGRDNARRLAARANHPLMALDLRNENGELEFPAEPIILKRGDLDVGILGVTCAGLMDVCADSRVEGLVLDDQEDVARHWIKKLDPKTDLLVMITHNGVQGDTTLARKLVGSGLDVIVGGHSHTRLRHPLLIGDVLVVQAGSHATNLGRLDLRVEDDRIVSYDGRLIATMAAGRVTDPELVAMVEEYSTRIENEFGQEIGRLATDWRRTGRGESNVGNWICDNLMKAAGADVALLNSGTLRKNFNAGPLTRLDINQLMPFSNLLETFEIDGAGLEKICLTNARGAEEDRHGILQVGGLRYAYTVVDGEIEMLEITVGGQPLDLSRVYTVACPDYVAMKAGLYMGMDKPSTRSTGMTVTEAITAAVKQAGAIDAKKDGRIARR